MEGRVTIIGLGCVGTSMGLALRQQGPELEIVGHDISQDNARHAQQAGAVTKTHWNLPASVEKAALVIMALPLPAVRETMELVGKDLEEGCVVTDTASLKAPAIAWARQYLPAHVHFAPGAPVRGVDAVIGHPLVGPEAGRADLFKGGIYCITPTADTTPEAIATLEGLARVLEARPYFLEPSEYDGLQAGIADLPALVAAALLRSTVDSPGWSDMRKVAGHPFATATALLASDPHACQQSALLNRENLLRRLDLLIAELRRFRRWLAEDGEVMPDDTYFQAAESRTRWINEKARGDWQDFPQIGEVPSAGERATQLLLGGLFTRRPRDRRQ